MSAPGTAPLAFVLSERSDLHGEHGMESNGGNMYTERERDDESNEHDDAKCS